LSGAIDEYLCDDYHCDVNKKMNGWMDELDRIVVMHLTVILLMTITMMVIMMRVIIDDDDDENSC